MLGQRVGFTLGSCLNTSTMRNLIFCCLAPLFALPSLSAQEELDSAQVRFFAGMLHWSATAVLGQDSAVYKTWKGDGKPWDDQEDYTLTEAHDHARYAAENAIAQYAAQPVDPEGRLTIVSKFPKEVAAGPFLTEIKMINAVLTDSLGNELTTSGMSTSYGNFYDKIKDAPDADQEAFSISTYLKPTPVGRVTGSIDMYVQSFSRYARVDLRPEDIGRQIDLGGLSLEVVEIDTGHIVLGYRGGQADLNLIQYGPDGTRIHRNSQEFDDKATLPGFVYTAFKDNPEITEDALADLVLGNDDLLSEYAEEDIHVVFRRYKNNERFTLYRPVLIEAAVKTITIE